MGPFLSASLRHRPDCIQQFRGDGTRPCDTHQVLGRVTASLSEKFDEQPAGFLRLFLLHLVTGTFDHVYTAHVRAGSILHALKSARALINAPDFGGPNDRQHLQAGGKNR